MKLYYNKIMLIWCTSILLCASCKPATTKPNVPKVKSVSCLVVDSADVASQVEARGLSSANKTSRLSFRLSGTIDKVIVKKGMAVKKNDTLVTIDKKDFELQLEKSEALLGLAQSKLERIKAKERSEVFEIAKAKIKALENDYKNKQKTYDSQLRLNKSRIVSDIDIDRLKTNAEVALQQLEIAKQELILLEKGARVEDIRLANKEVASSTVETRIHNQNLQYTALKAPFSGVITSVNVEQGEFYNVNLDPVAVILDDIYTIKIKISIAESQINKIKKNQKAKVTFDAIGGKNFMGRVTYISSKADTVSKTFPVEVTIKNEKAELKIGMFTQVRIVTGTTRKTILLPPQLLLHDHLGTYVLKLASPPKDKHAQVIRQNVKTGLLIENYIQVVSGVKAGDWIVKEGNHYIRHGSKVLVVDYKSQNRK
ncbi:efflux RND transporter periplasmic adaptor subunit [Candidatus Uabimicrobium sp. HlEnr_7]|uniref:efflux RND transporter periplasmic adaptor subunit n=1 Tax=Candidatus Uabimicrobium helgolandensis TaxID=3095367 RepID=UPI00355601BA